MGRNGGKLYDAMESPAHTLSNFVLTDRIHRELKKGETIYHSELPCHVSKKFPEGKRIAQVRREERGKLVKYPVKWFGTPKEALDYIRSLRPGAAGHSEKKQRVLAKLIAFFERFLGLLSGNGTGE